MKIAITAVKPHLDADVDPRFGRCPYFVVVETDNMSFEPIENDNQALGHGAGIQSASWLAEQGVRHVLTGNCGPNAHQTLTAANIQVVVGCAGTVRDAVEDFVAGRLRGADAPNIPGHAGMGPAANSAPTLPPGMTGPDVGRAGGRGGSRGMGRGRGAGGAGRSMRRGGGRGGR
jgi:predicted Fe-Mo cluster-binding NifX family protein